WLSGENTTFVAGWGALPLPQVARGPVIAGSPARRALLRRNPWFLRVVGILDEPGIAGERHRQMAAQRWPHVVLFDVCHHLLQVIRCDILGMAFVYMRGDRRNAYVYEGMAGVLHHLSLLVTFLLVFYSTTPPCK